MDVRQRYHELEGQPDNFSRWVGQGLVCVRHKGVEPAKAWRVTINGKFHAGAPAVETAMALVETWIKERSKEDKMSIEEATTEQFDEADAQAMAKYSLTSDGRYVRTTSHGLVTVSKRPGFKRWAVNLNGHELNQKTNFFAGADRLVEKWLMSRPSFSEPEEGEPVEATKEDIEDRTVNGTYADTAKEVEPAPSPRRPSRKDVLLEQMFQSVEDIDAEITAREIVPDTDAYNAVIGIIMTARHRLKRLE